MVSKSAASCTHSSRPCPDGSPIHAECRRRIELACQRFVQACGPTHALRASLDRPTSRQRWARAMLQVRRRRCERAERRASQARPRCSPDEAASVRARSRGCSRVRAAVAFDADSLSGLLGHRRRAAERFRQREVTGATRPDDRCETESRRHSSRGSLCTAGSKRQTRRCDSLSRDLSPRTPRVAKLPPAPALLWRLHTRVSSSRCSP